MLNKRERAIYTEKGEKLLNAIEAVCYARVKVLLECGADVNYHDYRYRTPFHEAAAKGDMDIIKLLLRHGGDVNAKDRNGYTVLHYALGQDRKSIKDGNIKVIKFLMRAGAKRARNVWGFDEFFNAAETNKSIEVLELFSDNGIHINEKYKWDYTPLMTAVRCNENPEIVEYLIKKGADINAVDWEGASVFMHSAANSHNSPENMKILLKYGCKTDVRDRTGESAMEFAKHNLNNKITDFLKTLEKKQ